MNISDILKPYGACPTAVQFDWYHRKTAFFHFGINTFTDKEWGDGTENPIIFNPTDLDCRQWIKVLKDGGFNAAILTTKHHDGFCLWPSKYTEHSVKNSPYKNGKGDIVREFVDACNEFGIKPGLYLSPWDRNHPKWGTKEYSDYYANQLTELMTEYGTIYECWWDGAGSSDAIYDVNKWMHIIRSNQPNCFVFGFGDAAAYVDGRFVGNENGIAGIDCYGTIDISSVKQMNCDELNVGKADGERFIPAECDVSIRPGWFYHDYQDNLVKTPEDLVNYWFTSAGRNSGVILNLPITREGLVHEKDAKSVTEWHKYMQQIFENNLLKPEVLVLDDAFSDKYTAKNILSSHENSFYVANKIHTEIVFELPETVEFNCFRLEECIEYGHRIREFVIEYEKDGLWETIVKHKCVGFCRSELFETVKSNKIRVRITDAVANPILRFFGIYKAPEHLVSYTPKKSEEKIDLTALPTTKTTLCEDGVEVEFGGIFPFNVVLFNGIDIGEFELQAFNGVNYYKFFEGKSGAAREIIHFNRIEGSYKMKLVVKSGKTKERVEDYEFFVISE